MDRRPYSGEVSRRGVNKESDKRSFSRNADKTHYLNTTRRNMMRGGIRL